MTSSLDKFDTMNILQMCAQKAHKSKQDTYIGFILYKKRVEFA